jgi:tRNA-splicing ligase RtcB
MTQPIEQRPANMHMWLCAPLAPDVQKALARMQATEDVRQVAVMPDVHLAREVCIGTVVGTSKLILPQAVGSDIGCGMAAVAFDGTADALEDELAAGRLLAGLQVAVPIMRQGPGRMLKRLPAELQDVPLTAPPLEKLKARDARVQLGTLGRGNHFLEFQADDEGRLWLMVHSGSRAVGQAIAQHHLAKAAATTTGLRCFAADSPAGCDYLADMEWALRYAQENRRLIVAAAEQTVERVLGLQVLTDTYLDCGHNHVRRETHGGEALWVHRKGAIPAAEGEAGIIPGSVGTVSLHVAGRGCAEAMSSSSHGAGRALSRDEARRRISVRQLERQMAGVWFDHRRAAGLREEAPDAYKDIEAVMRAQRELTRVVRRLRPLLSHRRT